MPRTILLPPLLVAICVAACQDRSAAQAMVDPPSTAWRSIDSDAASPAADAGLAVSEGGSYAEDPNLVAERSAPREPEDQTQASNGGITRVDSGEGVLPCDHGQIWREYDISPFTLRATATKRPELALIDWILHETGYEAWHGEPLAILSASRNRLRVYHAPQMQEKVADIVDRFVAGQAATQTFSIRVITLEHSSWRTKAQNLMIPVTVQTSGTQAWIMTKENAAVFLAEMQRRSGFREHGSPHLLVNNGHSTVIQAMRNRSYTRNIVLTGTTWPGYQPDLGQLEEGHTIEFTPLLSVDGRRIDAILKCSINQVEKLVPVMVDMPTADSPRQRLKIEVPQVAQFRFQERFRWPSDHVLLVGMGIVPQPVPGEGQSVIPGIPLPGIGGPGRTDLLVLIEGKGALAPGTPPAVTSGVAPGISGASPAIRQTQGPAKYHGRY